MISDPEEIKALVQSVLDGNAKELAAYKEVGSLLSNG